MFCAGVALTTVLGIEFRLEAREQLDVLVYGCELYLYAAAGDHL